MKVGWVFPNDPLSPEVAKMAFWFQHMHNVPKHMKNPNSTVGEGGLSASLSVGQGQSD